MIDPARTKVQPKEQIPQMLMDLQKAIQEKDSFQSVATAAGRALVPGAQQGNPDHIWRSWQTVDLELFQRLRNLDLDFDALQNALKESARYDENDVEAWATFIMKAYKVQEPKPAPKKKEVVPKASQTPQKVGQASSDELWKTQFQLVRAQEHAQMMQTQNALQFQLAQALHHKELAQQAEKHAAENLANERRFAKFQNQFGGNMTFDEPKPAVEKTIQEPAKAPEPSGDPALLPTETLPPAPELVQTEDPPDAQTEKLLEV